MKLDYKRFGNPGLVAFVPLAVAGFLILDRSERQGSKRASHPPAPLTVAGAEGEAHQRRGRSNADENWADVAAFMKQYSPKKWAAYEKLQPAAQAELRVQVAARYNEIARLPNIPDLYKIELERVQIEDDIFGELSNRRKSHLQGKDYTPEYINAVRKLVENRMSERKLRLNALTKVVAEDEDLHKNRNKFEQRVRARALAIERNGLGAPAQGIRRWSPGQPSTPPATIEPQDEILPHTPEE